METDAKFLKCAVSTERSRFKAFAWNRLRVEQEGTETVQIISIKTADRNQSPHGYILQATAPGYSAPSPM